MNKKILYLFLALALPVLVFLFLKYFGKNEFDIPVYYTEGIGDSAVICKIKSKGQYYVSDSVLNKWNWKKGTAILVSAVPEKETNELNEFVKEAQFDGLQLLSLSDNEKNLKDCVLFLREPWNAVLIDAQKRIRGYYKIGYRDEMDRLEVELKILLKKY
jgi:hypothetical protein